MIERSFDGVHYAGIGSVSPGNTISLRKSYQLHDIIALNGVVYYRLKINESSGNSSYSQVIRLKESGTKNMNITVNNPFNTQLNISFYNDVNQKVSIELYDLQGKKLVAEQATAIKGNNTFFIENLSKIAKGNYLLVIKSENGLQLGVEKVMKN